MIILFARFDQRSGKSYQQDPQANARLPSQAFDQGVIAGGRSEQRAKAVKDVALRAVQLFQVLGELGCHF